MSTVVSVQTLSLPHRPQARVPPHNNRNGIGLLPTSIASMFRRGRSHSVGRSSEPTDEPKPQVKNIYRQPPCSRSATKAGHLGGHAVTAKYRRDRFIAQSARWHSDPLSFAGLSLGEAAVGFDQTHTPDVRRRSQSVTAIPYSSILKKTNSEDRDRPPVGVFRRRLTSLRKQTTFQEHVSVYYYDHKERPMSACARDSERLKDEECERTTIAMAAVETFTWSEAKPRSPAPGGNTDASLAKTSGDKPKRDPDVGSDIPDEYKTDADDAERTIFEVTNTELVRETDASGAFAGHVLYLAIGVHEECVRARTTVKVMSGGYALIVIAYRNELDSGAGREKSHLHQYAKRIALPVAIDPYAVKACVHKDGHLTVEARVTNVGSCAETAAQKSVA